MTLSVSDITGWEATAGSQGRPRFIYNVAANFKSYTDATTTVMWNTNGRATGSDISTASGPATYGIDSRGAVQTSIASRSTNAYYWIANPASTTGVQQGIDCLAVINSNFNSGVWSSAKFEASANESTWTTLREYTFNGDGSNPRIWIPKINTSHTTSAFNAAGFTAQRTTNARYFRLHLVHSAGSHAPAMGEVVFGKSVFLKNWPRTPFDDRWEESDLNTWEAKSGDRVQYVNYTGRKVRTFSYRTDDDDEIAALDELWKHTSHGANGFLFEAQTALTSDASKPSFYRADDPKWMMPITWGAAGREWVLKFVEQPPYLSNGDR
jgi:hypothetical protein